MNGKNAFLLCSDKKILDELLINGCEKINEFDTSEGIVYVVTNNLPTTFNIEKYDKKKIMTTNKIMFG